MKNLYLLENINDSNLKKTINTDGSEIITFDYYNCVIMFELERNKKSEWPITYRVSEV